MTTQEIIDYYANLLILQYISKPKAYATIQALVKPVIMDQLPLDVQNAFNVDTAVGVQLDVIGKYCGVTRYGYDFTGAVTLDDTDFRSLVKFAIIRNTGSSSLASIQELLHQFFAGDFLIFDHANMQMDYFFSTAIGSAQLAEMILIQNLLPKPSAVGVGALIYAPNINAFFGWRTYTLAGFNVNGFNNYTTYDMTWTWLDYSYAIVVP